MKRHSIPVASEAETVALAGALARLLPPGTVLALNGTLGAGKTRFVQALAAAVGVADRTVVSPTFVLVQEYRATVPIYHFDAYRLRGVDDFLDLGVNEYFASQGVCLIEWADRVASCLPAECLLIHLAVTGENTRTVTLEAHGERYVELLNRELLAGG